jgi:diacylglycerol kinase family enzyme
MMPARESAGGRCIIFNPAAGRGRARQQIHRLQSQRGPNDEFLASTGPGHAEELAFQAAQGHFTNIIAAGGDGTVHEVANGILRAGNDTVAFAPWPIGSANDYAFALGLPNDWPLRPNLSLQRRRVDAGRLVTGQITRYFVNGVGLGFNAAVTAESRRISRLRGVALYGLAFLMAVLRRYDFVNLAVTIDNREFAQSTLALTIDLGPREGGFLVTPRARLNDGWFDLVQAGPIRRYRAMVLLPKLISGRLPTNDPLIQLHRGRRIVIRSADSLPIHLDGELIEPPAAEQDIMVELLPAAMTVLATPETPYLVS